MVEAAPQTASSASEFKPHLFGKFFLLQRLAIGGMAEIYRSRVPGAGGFEKELVVKILQPRYAENRRVVQMFLDEARLAARLILSVATDSTTEKSPHTNW